MQSSTKLFINVAASILGVALAGGAAFAATGSLTGSDAPGQVLQVAGVGPASAEASGTAVANADAEAKGLFGTEVSATEGSELGASTDGTATAQSAGNAQASVNTADPVEPSVAAKDASSVAGSETGMSVSAWGETHAGVEIVGLGAAVSVDVTTSIGAGN